MKTPYGLFLRDLRGGRHPVHGVLLGRVGALGDGEGLTDDDAFSVDIVDRIEVARRTARR